MQNETKPCLTDGSCETCSVEAECYYPYKLYKLYKLYKPCDRPQPRKFWNYEMRVEYYKKSLEFRDAKARGESDKDKWNNFMREQVRIMNITGKIYEERRRQIEQEGFDAAHDSQHRSVDLKNAAMCYVLADGPAAPMPQEWRWGSELWKPKSRLRNLVRAGALYLAAADIADDGSPYGGLEAKILRREAGACAALIDMLIREDLMS